MVFSITCSATAYMIAIMHGKQQQTATPIMHASDTQKTTKNTSNARNATQTLSKSEAQDMRNNNMQNACMLLICKCIHTYIYNDICKSLDSYAYHHKCYHTRTKEVHFEIGFPCWSNKSQVPTKQMSMMY